MSDVDVPSSPLVSPKPSFHEKRSGTNLFDEKTLNALVEAFGRQQSLIERKIELIEFLDLNLSIATYKIYEDRNEFKTQISEVRDERDKLLTSAENKSELSLILHDLDKKISDLQLENEDKLAFLNQHKIETQQEIEQVTSELDYHYTKLQEILVDAKQLMDIEQNTMYRPQVMLISEEYKETIDHFEKVIENLEMFQTSGWKVQSSETKLCLLLEEYGVTFTQSCEILTKSGSRISFEEAQRRGYFQPIKDGVRKIKDFIRSMQDVSQPHEEGMGDHDEESLPRSMDSSRSSKASSLCSANTSEEVQYLKYTVGKALTLALAEITAKQPRDPIHYLGHWLFKFRYNQEITEVQKAELDELDEERKRLAKIRWHQMIEDEARNAVIDMVIRAEEIALENELKRIIDEQNMGENEEGEDPLLEEARDKFE